LPKEIVGKVEVRENHEPLVELQSISRLRLVTKFTDKFLARKTVAEKLVFVSNNLPTGLTLVIADAYRSPERQEEEWKKQYKKTKDDNPDMPEEELVRRTRLFVAQPSVGLGGHQTGGAIDLTLGDVNGNELNMGTKLHEFISETETHAKNITGGEKEKREILLRAMEQAGFKNYPGEWWHFSFGERLWAAYSKKRFCFYGPVDI
jgi:D-alanyl-D-alanine dipeptidase